MRRLKTMEMFLIRKLPRVPCKFKLVLCSISFITLFRISHEQSFPSCYIESNDSHVFLACFMGLCQKMPTCPAVNSLTNQILGETIESDEAVLPGSTELESKTRQSLAIAVCESLRTTTSQDLLVGLFPLLCRLTNVENDGLRRAAGKILGGMNLSEAISRERQRAEQADIRAREIEEENVAMLEEIEYLQAENEELQRQVSCLQVTLLCGKI